MPHHLDYVAELILGFLFDDNPNLGPWQHQNPTIEPFFTANFRQFLEARGGIPVTS